ncbi:deoxyribose-phosphate aldolase [Sinomicrobium weinanense]|uniref:Deoxyribose-phosphate aldolase n=1 Tax=Sinomicrobium weinanense TaxID=2842200 RepID=A0A926Q403_9FLAO|nr:deoxyribose-phosphate aldolase [Sinomicrobium weinanense]MBC9796330.1 deoxyribose-phosphate aldolase [Sinomicrobium weinanense]MBU3122468.1 deoxyribose-phosphate aldolase [Sinomicrobium weinanense]
MKINRYIDHTLLKPVATERDIEHLCKEALQYRFYSVCVHGCYVSVARKTLGDADDIHICAVAGFPLGAMSTKTKIFESEQAIADGADEIDMVINLGWLKSGDTKKAQQEIGAIKKAIGPHILKVIIETCYLTDAEKALASTLAADAGADFVKTSTGFGTGGATLRDIEIMKEAVEGKARLKASGGIKSFEVAKKYIDLGVTRIGTSSGVAIVKGLTSNESY